MISIADKARKGEPLDNIIIIDGHCHIGLCHNFHIPCSNAEGLICSMDAIGINIACISAMSSIGPDYRYGNEIVIDAVSKYPGRFIGYAVVNPNYEDDMEAELERCLSYSGIKAIKLHPGIHGCPADHKNYHKAYELANERHYTVLIHTWGRNDVSLVDKIASQYPDANFIMGHSGADILAMEDTIKIVNKRENVFSDLTISMVYEGNVEWFVGEMGSKKVLFGTDMPYFDPRPNFGRVALAQISDDEKKDILGLNMKKLLNI